MEIHARNLNYFRSHDNTGHDRKLDDIGNNLDEALLKGKLPEDLYASLNKVIGKRPETILPASARRSAKKFVDVMNSHAGTFHVLPTEWRGTSISAWNNM